MVFSCARLESQLWADQLIRSPMYTGKIVFAQLMSLIPRRDFSACVARYKGDYRSKNLSRHDQFLVMCLAQYAAKNSLRDIEASLIAVEHKL